MRRPCALFAIASVAIFSARVLAEAPSSVAPPTPLSVLAQFDRDRNGRLAADEHALWAADKAVRRETARAQRAELLATFDTNHDGRLDEEERVAAMAGREREKALEQTARIRRRLEKVAAEEVAASAVPAKVAQAEAAPAPTPLSLGAELTEATPPTPPATETTATETSAEAPLPPSSPTLPAATREAATMVDE
jgi:hypothetical protein